MKSDKRNKILNKKKSIIIIVAYTNTLDNATQKPTHRYTQIQFNIHRSSVKKDRNLFL